MLTLCFHPKCMTEKPSFCKAWAINHQFFVPNNCLTFLDPELFLNFGRTGPIGIGTAVLKFKFMRALLSHEGGRHMNKRILLKKCG